MHRQYSAPPREEAHPVREGAVRQDCVIAQRHDCQVVPDAERKERKQESLAYRAIFRAIKCSFRTPVLVRRPPLAGKV